MLPTWAPWVACGVLAIGGYAVYERSESRLAKCDQRMADFKRDLATKALELRVEVAEESAAAAKQALTEARQIEATAATEKERVRVVTVKEDCQRDPGIGAMFDAIDRLLEPPVGAGAGQGAGRSGAAGSVRGAPAPLGR